MKTWETIRVGLLVLVALATLSGCGRFGAQDTGGQEQGIADQEQQLADLKEQVAEMEKKLAESRAKASEAPQSSQPVPPSAQREASPQQVAPAPKPRSFTLPAGTPIAVRTTTEISTKAASTGDPFEASLEEPLMGGTAQIAPKGTRVIGVVAHSDKGGRVKGRAQLEVRLRNLVTENGQVVDVNTNTLEMTAEKSTKDDALKVGVATGIGAAIGAIAGGGKGAAIGAGAGAGAGAGTVLLTRGEAAVLPAESVLNFELTAPVTIVEKQ